MNRPLILGCGHPDRGDDAVGLEVARRAGGICVPDPLRLLELWPDKDAILIDAVVTGCPPGRVHVWDGLSVKLEPGTFRFSTHSFGIPEAIELARALDHLPRSLTLYGIEAADVTPGAGLTAAVDEAAGRLARRIGGSM